MKRFLLFAGEDYYPGGGWHDFRGSYANVGAAKRARPRDLGPEFPYASIDWAHIVDAETGEIAAVWDDSLGWFRSMEERAEAATAAYVKQVEARQAAGKTGPFVASVGQSVFPVATSAELKL